MPIGNEHFSNFTVGGNLQVTDIVVGLRSGTNYQFTISDTLPVGTVVPISQGGTGATTITGAQTNLDLLIGTNVEAWSANLDALAALSGTGFLVQTGSASFAERTIQGTSNQITVANGSGVSANPTLSLSTTVNFPGTVTIQSTTAINAIINDDTFASATDENIPTALSVKEYIASVVGSGAGGSDGDIQYNNGGLFGGDSGFTTNGSGTLVCTGQLTVDNLNLNANTLSSTNINGNIVVTPNGTGNIVLDGLNWPTSDGSANSLLYTDGSGNLGWTTSTFPVTVGATGTIIRSNGTNWVASTATFANTYTANDLLYASSSNTVAGLSSADNGVLITSGSGVPSISSTLPSAVQGNITELGDLTTLYVGNLELTSNTISSTNSNGNINLTPDGSGNVIVPTPTTGTAAVNVNYLNANPAGVSYYLPARLASTAILSATYNNGSSGVGATLTANATGALEFDGVNPSVGDAVLMKNQSTAYQNGLYIVTTAGGVSTNGVLTRSTQYDTPAQAVFGASIDVVDGTDNAATLWQQDTVVNTIGSDSISYQAISSGGGGTSPGGSNGEIQYNNSSTFGGDSGFTTDGAGNLVSTGSLIVDNLELDGNTFSSVNTNGDININTDGSGTVVINSSTGITEVLNDGTMAADSASALVTQASIVTYVQSQRGTVPWTVVTGASQSMAVNNGYVANHSTLCTLTLPSTAVVGNVIYLQGLGAGLFKIGQNASQYINFGNTTTTTGTGGYLESNDQFDSLTLVCVVANDGWCVLGGVQGIFTVN